MLENRPIVQRSLIGFGAFSLVFTAAMAGTAFMISGGFDVGGNARPHSVQQYAAAAETAWTQPAYAATPTYVTPSPQAEPVAQPDEYAPAAYATADDLDGDMRAARNERIQARNEADILRDIDRELAAYERDTGSYQSETAAYADPGYAEPRPDADIIDAKERAAAMQNAEAF